MSVVKVSAILPAASMAPKPIVVPPSLNRTFPVGVPEAEVTIAVKVTACPTVEGFAEEAIVVVVFARTSWEIAAEVLEPKCVSPP